MRLRDRIGRILRAFGGAINGRVYDRLDAIEQNLASSELRLVQRLEPMQRLELIEANLAELVPPVVERYEMRVLRKFVRAGFSPAVIYDIGAADGVWSAEMHPIFPQSESHLFEPLANHLPSYRASLDTILPKFPSFTMHPVAVGGVTGQVQMTVHPEGYGSSVFHGGDWDKRPRIDVAGWRLDEYVAEHALPLPDLIKIDAQASEVLILGNAKRCLEHASMIFSETWFDKAYGPDTPLMTEVTELLEANDFRLVEIGHKFYNPDHTLFGCDAFYLKRSLLSHYGATMPAGPW